MKVLVLILGLVLAGTAGAQEAGKKKKAPPKKQQVAHKKPTSEQIRRFNELQKKQR